MLPPFQASMNSAAELGCILSRPVPLATPSAHRRHLLSTASLVSLHRLNGLSPFESRPSQRRGERARQASRHEEEVQQLPGGWCESSCPHHHPPSRWWGPSARSANPSWTCPCSFSAPIVDRLRPVASRHSHACCAGAATTQLPNPRGTTSRDLNASTPCFTIL